MRDPIILLVHLIATLARLMGPGGRRCAGNHGGSGSVPRPPGRRCARPCASAGS